MDVLLSENQIELVNDICEQEGFTDFELATASGSLKGDNYLGVITRVSVKSDDKKLELLMKSSSNNESLRKVVPVRKTFLREIFVYEKVLPAFQQFQKEQGFTEGFSGCAKIYGSCDNDPDEFLILENLKEIGYSMWNRKEPMNQEHVELVLKEYGKLHATSIAIKEKIPELYKNLTESMDNVFEPSGDKRSDMMKALLTNGLKTVKGNQVATDALERLSLVSEKYLLEDIREEEEKLVILHGDCWCNNMLFKYEDPESKKPTKVCLIDWQIASHGSPAKDLAHFLFTCTPKEILADYRKYLKIYHNSVCECLRRMHCDAETLFPFSLLERHWQKYTKFGIYMSLMMIKLMLSEGSEVPDMDEIVNSGKDIVRALSFDSVNADSYRQRVIDVVTVAADNNWV